MKFTLFFVLSCLSFCFVTSLTRTSWGNVNTRVLGTENVFVEWSFLKVKEYNLTYPKVNISFRHVPPKAVEVFDFFSLSSNNLATIQIPNHWHSSYGLRKESGQSEVLARRHRPKLCQTPNHIATQQWNQFNIHFLHHLNQVHPEAALGDNET